MKVVIVCLLLGLCVADEIRTGYNVKEWWSGSATSMDLSNVTRHLLVGESVNDMAYTVYMSGTGLTSVTVLREFDNTVSFTADAFPYIWSSSSNEGQSPFGTTTADGTWSFHVAADADWTLEFIIEDQSLQIGDQFNAIGIGAGQRKYYHLVIDAAAEDSTFSVFVNADQTIGGIYVRRGGVPVDTECKQDKDRQDEDSGCGYDARAAATDSGALSDNRYVLESMFTPPDTYHFVVVGGEVDATYSIEVTDDRWVNNDASGLIPSVVVTLAAVAAALLA